MTDGPSALRRYIDKAMVDLPALPNVVAKVLEAADRDEPSAAEVERLVLTDQAISAKLLKVVNSAYYGLPRRVGHVGQAITVVGLHQLRNMVLSLGVLQALSAPTPRVVAAQRSHWRLAFAAATASRAVALEKGFSPEDRETAYLAGLLHDVGRLFLISLFNIPYQHVLRESARRPAQLPEVECELLGVDHAMLGGALVERWNLPEHLVRLVRDHEMPADVEPDAPLMCVHVADRLADEIEAKETGLPVPEIDPRALDWLGFDDKDLTALRGRVAEKVREATDMLGVL